MNKKGYNQTANEQAFGANGFNEITSAGASVAIEADDRFAILIASEDAVFNFSNEVDKGVKTATNFSLADGRSLYGYFKNIVVTSGKLLVYYAS